MHYLERMKLELRLRKEKGLDIIPCIFGAGFVTIPFVLIYTNKINNIKFNGTRVVNTANEIVSNTFIGNVSKDKNPSTADPLPDHDLDINTIHPSPIDQHGTYGQAY